MCPLSKFHKRRGDADMTLSVRHSQHMPGLPDELHPHLRSMPLGHGLRACELSEENKPGISSYGVRAVKRG